MFLIFNTNLHTIYQHYRMHVLNMLFWYRWFMGRKV